MTKRIITFILIGFSLAFISSARAESFPDFPMAFYGQATLNGSSMTSGYTIRAYYGSELGGEIKIKDNGVYGYTDLNKQRLLVKKGSGIITFKFVDLSGVEKEGSTSVSYPSFVSGGTIEKNLFFTTTVITSSSGGGGGGGGGGAPAPIVTTTTTISLSAEAQKVDTNNDGVVNVLEFVSLMANWGKVGPSVGGDFNSDGKVDVFDFVMLMANWTK
ncbi:MAG: hypothetical protein PHG66_04195 [Candidatus Colwellbacteria bacterium]|nr:hypothetical protein [Candidatus Colwellbacteria bacterium]